MKFKFIDKGFVMIFMIVTLSFIAISYLSSQDVEAVKKTIVSKTFNILPKVKVIADFKVPSADSTVKLEGTIKVSGGILALITVSVVDADTGQIYLNKRINEYGKFSIKLPDRNSYYLSLYNDAILAGEVKRVTANVKLNYN